MSASTIVALVAIAVCIELSRRVRRLLYVQREDRHELREAWRARTEAVRLLREAEERWRPGFEVVERHWPTAFEVYDRRDVRWGSEPLASCTTREAADAAVRLLGGGR